MNKANLYYPELDSLRFFAFLLVLIHHTPYSKFIPFWESLHTYGWIGVDLFLCLSSFLFAKLLFVEYQEKGDINVRYFYIRRALRIWPLYFLFTGMIFFYSTLVLNQHDNILLRLTGMLTFTDNLFTMAWGYNSILAFSAHLWTISYEEQVYLAIPWVLRLFYRMKKTTTLEIIGLFALLCMAVRAFFIYRAIPHPDIWVFPLTHFESVLGGLIIGLGLVDKYLKLFSSWILLLLGLSALWLVLHLPNVSTIQWKLMLTYPLVGIGWSLILFVVMQNRVGVLSTLLRNKVLGYLGKISYGLYVYHLVGIYLAFRYTSLLVSPARVVVHPIVAILTALVMTILISIFSYEVFEKRFLRMKDRFTFIFSRPV